MEVIKIDRLTKDYGNNKGIFNISFSVNEGEVFGFLGPNGAGKTTTIRQLMGFINPDKGTCKINGLDCKCDSDKIQKTLGYIPGETAFFDEMTCRGFINFIARYRGVYNKDRIEELIELFELDTRGKIRKLSKGMKQKLSIICALMGDPDVLILDEPTSGLDPLMQNVFTDLILKEKQKGKTILMSSHIFEEVEKTCDKVGIIRKGEIVAIEDVDKLRASKAKIYVVTFKDVKDVKDFEKFGFNILSKNNLILKICITNNLNEFLKSLSNYEILNVKTEKQRLEDLFLSFYGGSKND